MDSAVSTITLQQRPTLSLVSARSTLSAFSLFRTEYARRVLVARYSCEQGTSGDVLQADVMVLSSGQLGLYSKRSVLILIQRLPFGITVALQGMTCKHDPARFTRKTCRYLQAPALMK